MKHSYMVFVRTCVFVSLQGIPRSGIAGPSGGWRLHCQQPCIRVLVAPSPCQHLVLSGLFLAILLCVQIFVFRRLGMDSLKPGLGDRVCAPLSSWA